MSKHRSRLRNGYVEQITRMSLTEEFIAPHPTANSHRRKMALAEAIYLVRSHTYGIDTNSIKDLVSHSNIDTFLLRLIARRRGPRRTQLLTMLNAIPSHRPIAQHLQPLLRSRNHNTRIAALLATLSANPSMSIQTIASLSYHLRPFDLARIVVLLRRGLLPIAYEPLLASDNRNLQMLGLSIVRNFGIEIADKHLRHIIATSCDAGIIGEAIYTLSSLRRSLGQMAIRTRVEAMPTHRRKELCRHLAREGYSTNALKSLFTPEEVVYSESLINTYKRSLRCLR